MTLNEFTSSYCGCMANVVILIRFLVGKRNNKEIFRLVDFIENDKHNMFYRMIRLTNVTTVIYTIIDIIIEIGLIVLSIILNNVYLRILLSIIAIGWAFVNIRLYTIENNMGKNLASNIITDYNNNKFHKSIESTKNIVDDIGGIFKHLNKFDLFIHNFKSFKLIVCSLGKIKKLDFEISDGGRDDVEQVICRFMSYLVSNETYLDMTNDIHSVISEKYDTSKEIFDTNNIDKLNEYIDNKFNSSFIESIYKNITPSDNAMINILFILVNIIYLNQVSLKIGKERKSTFMSVVDLSDRPADWATQMIEFKIFKYGFDKLENLILCMNDEELLECIHSL